MAKDSAGAKTRIELGDIGGFTFSGAGGNLRLVDAGLIFGF